MRAWLKNRRCQVVKHTWRTVDLPGFPKAGVYCQRCTEIRMLDRKDPHQYWLCTYRGRMKSLRPKIPVVVVRKIGAAD